MSKRRATPPAPFITLFPRLAFGPRILFVLWAGYLVTLGVVAFTFHRIGDYAVETDFYWIYAPHAKELLRGTILLDQFRGPGYEMLLAGAGWLVGDMFRTGMLLSLLSAGAVLWLTYRLVERLFGAEQALLTSVALAVNHTFIIASYTAATDMVFNLLAVLVVFLVLYRGEYRWHGLALAGLVTGFAYVTRYNTVAFLVAVPVGVLFLNIYHLEWKRRLAGTALFLLGALLVILPWGFYTLEQTGRFTYNNNFYNIAYEMYAKGKIGWDDYWGTMAPRFSSYRDVVVYDPSRFFSQLGQNALEHFWNDMTLLVAPPLGVFALGGIVAFIVARVNRRQAMVLLLAAVYYLVLLPIFYGERFSLFLAPTILLLVVAFFRWGVLPAGGFASFGLKHMLLLGLLAYSTIFSYQRVSSEIGGGPVEILDVRDAYVRLYGGKDAGATIVARKPHIAYYLKMQFVIFPAVDTMPRLLAELKNNGAQYLYYSTVEAGMRPQFQFLLEPRRAPKELVPVLKVDYPPAVLYRIENN